VGEQCSSILSGSSVYSFTSAGLTFVKVFSSIKAYSSSLQFIVAGSKLYGYNGSSFISTSLAAYSSFSLNNYQNNLIVCGYNSTGSSSFSVQATIYFVTFTSNIFNIFNTLDVSSTNNPTNFIPLMISLQMTKIHYQFYTGSNLTVTFKDVDFDAEVVTDITFQSQSQFLATSSKMTAFIKANYFLSDNYLTIRNDSSLSTSNSTIFV
jgi:hypothetical protein